MFRPRLLSLLLVLASSLVAFGVGAGAADAADGDLDASFGNGGQLNSDPTAFTESPADAVLDPQGRMVVVFSGFPKEAANRAFVARYLANGEIDGSFGSGGVTEIPWTTTNESQGPAGVAIDGQGRIVVGGDAVKGVRGFDIAAARLLPGGTLDPSFGEGGVVTIDVPGDGFDVGESVAVDSLGRVLVAGRAIKTGGPTPQSSMTVVRWTEAGVPDPTFGEKGIAKVNVAGLPQAGASTLALDGSGRLVVGGSAGDEKGSSPIVARLLDDGSLDPSFGGGGIVPVNFRIGSSSSVDSLVLDGEKIVVTGDFKDESTRGLGVGRLLPNGAADVSFAGSGTTTVTLAGADVFANALALDPAGRLIVGGLVQESLAANAALFRFTSAGASDPTFGNGGVARASFGAAFSLGVTPLVDSSGRYLLFGSGSSASATVLGFARFLTGYPTAGPTQPSPPTVKPPPATPPKPKCAGRTATVVGTSGADRLKGTKKADVIVGLGGNDTIKGLGGNDVVCAGAGADKVFGGAGNDQVFGEGGNDMVFGGPGADRLLGQAGADTLVGGPGKDQEIGGPGKDRQR